MPITLGSNIASLRGQRQLSRTSAELGTVLERLSSGQRINKASDDAAGLSIADSLNAKSRVFNQGVRNLNDGLSLLSIADSAIENLSSIVVRLEELAEQSANGVYSNRQRKAMDDEAQALSKEFFRISKTTEFNGQRLLAGEFDAVNLQGGVGENAVLSAGVGGAIGTGRFTSLQSVKAYSAEDFALGDFNGDGILDFASSDYSGTMNVLLGLGNGAFAPKVQYQTSYDPHSVTTADFNGDGVLDLVTADKGSNVVSLFLGRADGTFQTAVSYAAGATPFSIVSGDFNGDGLYDLILDNGSVLIGQGDGGFSSGTAVSGISWNIVSGDLNGDGILDLVNANLLADTIGVLLGTGNGTFASEVTYAVGQNAWAVELGDFNGDGILDVVSADYDSGTVSVLLGLGDGTLSSSKSFAVGLQTRSVVAADFNGDGYADIAATDYGSGSVSILLGNGDGSFTVGSSYAGVLNATAIAAGDFNGDGVVDLLAGEYVSNQSYVLLGESHSGVAPVLPFSLKTLADARQALPVFKRKREQLATQRGQIGAFQSRIDVAANVLTVSSENFKAAESRIRDADIADESSRLVRLNILQQAASSVLAQANQQPALALQLLLA